MKKIHFGIILFLSCSSCFAVDAWQNAQIKRILVHDNGSANYPGLVNVYMYTDMASSVPSCVSSQPYHSHFAIDLSRPGAQAMYSTLLAAYMANIPVNIEINSTCAEGIALLRNIYVGE